MDKETKEEFENLARLVQGGFLELKENVISLEGRFDNLEGHFDNLEGRFDNLEGRFDVLEEKVDALDTKVSRIDRRTENQADSLYEDIHGLKDRVAAVEKKTGIVPPKPKLATA